MKNYIYLFLLSQPYYYGNKETNVNAFILSYTKPSNSFQTTDIRYPIFSKKRSPSLIQRYSSSPLNFDYETPLPESKYTQVLSNVYDEEQEEETPAAVSKVAMQLRNYFDSIYSDPRAPSSKRFVWDPWFVKCKEGKYGTLAPLPGDVGLYTGGSGGSMSQEHQEGTEEEEEDDEEEEEMILDLDYNENNIIPGEREAVGNQIQYSLKRVQASVFFSNDQNDSEKEDSEEQDTTIEESLYETFINEITTLGQSIGLSSTTPPWLSLYTHNDFQNFHTDASHGPLAWVYALPPFGDETPFEGGDTMILHPSILDYWKTFAETSTHQNASGKETPSIVRHIPTKRLGQCIAFDPRVPHGVSQVKMMDPNDIRKGRLVLHGWFADPQVIFVNSDPNASSSSSTTSTTTSYWCEEELEENSNRLNNVISTLLQTLSQSDIGRVLGYLAIKVYVTEHGLVENIQAVCDTIVADPMDYRGIIGYDQNEHPVYEDAVSDVKLTIFEALKGIYFTDLYHDHDDRDDDEDVNDNVVEQDNRMENILREVIVPFAFE